MIALGLPKQGRRPKKKRSACIRGNKPFNPRGPTVMDTKQMLEEIRRVIARCKASERDAYDALVAEAEGWAERLRELDAEDE